MTRTFDATGGFTERTEGSPVVTLSDGSRFTVGEDALEAPDGTVFSLVYGAGQSEESAPLESTFEIVREQRRLRTLDERLDDWRSEHPDGSDTDRTAFEAAIVTASAVTSTRTVQGALLARLAQVADDEQVAVTVRLADAPPMHVPDAAPWLADTDPAAALALWEDRVLAIEDRRTEMALLQEDTRRELEARGGTVVYGHWMANVLDLVVPARLAQEIVDDPRFVRVQLTPRVTGDSDTWGNEVRVAMQTKPYADAGYNGSEPSGKNGYSDMFAVVIDDCIDEDHPVWKTSASGASRLQHVWRHGSGWSALDPATQDSCTSVDANFHGQRVTAIFMADLLDGQDPAITTLTERRKRTGMTTEAVFDFIEDAGGSLDHAGTLSPDVVNWSRSYCENGTPPNDPVCLNYCDLDDTSNDDVDALYLLDTVVVNTGGNVDAGYADPATCAITPPGTAAGSLTPAESENQTTDRDTNSLQIIGGEGTSPYGVDTHGRVLLDLTTTGRLDLVPTWDDTYTTTAVLSSGTSFAAPHIAGAVTNLKHHLKVLWPSLGNNPGNPYVLATLMADGQLQDLSLAPARSWAADPARFAGRDTPPDEMWGHGRMQMRLFTSEGMDAPWAVSLVVKDLVDGEVWDRDLQGGDPLPATADTLRAAVWWFEPNVGSTESPATIETKLVRDGSVWESTAPEKPIGSQRLRVFRPTGGATLVGSRTFTIRVEGDVVPASTHTDYFSGEQKRKVHLAYFWEDDARNDQDGPGADIQ